MSKRFKSWKGDRFNETQNNVFIKGYGEEWGSNPRPSDSQSVTQNQPSSLRHLTQKAKITQLVECNLAKVKVEGSNPFFRLLNFNFNMSIELALFYTFSSLAIISALMVISLANAVYSVLFLIIVFCNVASLLLLSGVEFLAFILLIVYVGAIAVLFLFVVMMLNIKTSSFRSSIWSCIPVSFIISLSFILQLACVLNPNFEVVNFSYNNFLDWNNWVHKNSNLNNIEVVGSVLYTKYSFIFLTSGFILLIAMIGAIALTMHQKSSTKKQVISVQLARNSFGITKFVSLRK